MAEGGISVPVIGGGIGGLSAALSLLGGGLDVHVYEQASETGAVGREQDPLPPSGRPGAGTARRRDGTRLDRLVDRRGRVAVRHDAGLLPEQAYAV
jgi:flavin-dependent dehydrogenase